MRNKIFTRIIITTLLCAFLTFNVGKVTRVSAVGTTVATAAGATLLAVGIIYCSYMALTGAAVQCPNTIDDITQWLSDMGQKVVQFPSGRAAYQELYPQMLGVTDEPLTDMLDRAWTWSKDKLISWANDFSSIDVLQNIATYEQDLDVFSQVTTDFSGYNIAPTPNYVSYNGNTYTLQQFYAMGYSADFSYGQVVVRYLDSSTQYLVNSNILNPVRNYLWPNGKYSGQVFENGEWTFYPAVNAVYGTRVYYNGNRRGYLTQDDLYTYNYSDYGEGYNLSLTGQYDWPIFSQADTYVHASGEIIPAENVQSTELVKTPQYPMLPSDDNNKYPIIPYVQLPFDPNWIDPVTQLPGGGNWGFNLSELLDTIEDLADTLLDIGALSTLINTFKDLMSSDDYYIYYDNEGDTYYQYYTISNYGGDTYNIDVSHVDEELPVDMNSIVVYTHNRYLDELKRASQNGGSLLRDYIVFWYDVAPDAVYLIGGGLIGLILAAFVGKWGHS